MEKITIEKISLSRDVDILKTMDCYVDWNMSAHPLSNLVKISKGGVFIAKSQQKNVGMIFAFPYYKSIGWIAFLVVDPDYRRRGIGKALMTHAINFLKLQKIKSIGLYATEIGTPLYEQMGFIKVLTSKRFTISGAKNLEILKNKIKTTYDNSFLEIKNFRDFNHNSFKDIVSMDSKIFGANRELIFENRLKMGSWNCFYSTKENKLEAFGMSRLIDNHFGFIGPLIGSESAVFQKVLPKIIVQLIDDSASKIYLGTNSNKMAKWLLSNNFNEGEKPSLMFLGDQPTINEQMWAICHPSKG